MRPLSLDHRTGVDLFLRQLDDLTAAAEVLAETELLDPSRCRGWSRLDVLVHVRVGLDEMSAVSAAPSDRSPDRDAASYWSAHPDDRDDDPVPHILWTRRTADAYSRPAAAMTHLRLVAERARARVVQLPDAPVLFQGQVLTSGDFLATWVVELAVHQLDLDVTGPPPAGADLARRTLEAVAEADLPEPLDPARRILLGLGRTTPLPGDPPLGPRFPTSL